MYAEIIDYLIMPRDISMPHITRRGGQHVTKETNI